MVQPDQIAKRGTAPAPGFDRARPSSVMAVGVRLLSVCLLAWAGPAMAQPAPAKKPLPKPAPATPAAKKTAAAKPVAAKPAAKKTAKKPAAAKPAAKKTAKKPAAAKPVAAKPVAAKPAAAKPAAKKPAAKKPVAAKPAAAKPAASPLAKAASPTKAAAGDEPALPPSMRRNVPKFRPKPIVKDRLPKPAAGAPPVLRPRLKRVKATPRKVEASGIGNLPGNAVTIRILLQKKQYASALKVANRVLKRYPKDLEVAMQRARLLFWTGHKRAAEQQAVRVYRADRFNTEALRLVGEIRAQRNDLRGAVRAYREAQLRGDGDVVLVYRLISLYMELRRPDLALAQLRPGMELPEHLQRRIAEYQYPLGLQLLGGLTFYQGSTWQRIQGSVSYRWSPMFALLGGLHAESRAADRVGYQTFAQLFFDIWRFSGDLRFAWSPTPSDFLPPLDIWLSGAFSFTKFAVGIWGRYAAYQISPLYSLGPYLTFYLGNWEIRPGYLLVWRGETRRGKPGQIGHTIFLRGRWDYDPSSALLLWGYWGEEAVFGNRTLQIADESGLSLVVGWERWLTARWGLRALVTYTNIFNLDGDLWDVVLAVRTRL